MFKEFNKNTTNYTNIINDICCLITKVNLKAKEVIKFKNFFFNNFIEKHQHP